VGLLMKKIRVKKSLDTVPLEIYSNYIQHVLFNIKKPPKKSWIMFVSIRYSARITPESIFHPTLRLVISRQLEPCQ
jgi:hypothetical protein